MKQDATELRRALRVIGAAARAKDAPEIRESDRRALRDWLRVVAAMAKGGKSRRNPSVCVDSPPELFGAASPHQQHAPSIADMEIDELVTAARSGDASAQEELGLRGIAWNPRRRRNPDLLTMAGNPGSAAMAKAAAAYRQFHGCAPKKIRRIGKGSGVLVALGDLLEIVYKAKRGDRKGPAWWHKFGKGSVLASTPDGKHLFILNPKGTRTAVDWQRGIVS